MYGYSHVIDWGHRSILGTRQVRCECHLRVWLAFRQSYVEKVANTDSECLRGERRIIANFIEVWMVFDRDFVIKGAAASLLNGQFDLLHLFLLLQGR